MEAVAVTVAEASAALGLGTTKTRELIAMGVLPAARVGRRVLVPTDSLRAFVAALAAEHAAEQASEGTGRNPSQRA
jgi:excisionase family DNA binding protein